MPNLYRITWLNPPKENHRSYWEGAVVVAETEEEAIKIHPDGKTDDERGSWASLSDWPTNPREIKVEYLGTTLQTHLDSVILSSFIHP